MTRGLTLDEFVHDDPESVSFRYVKALHVDSIPIPSNGFTLLHPLGVSGFSCEPIFPRRSVAVKHNSPIALLGRHGARVGSAQAFCEYMMLRFSDRWVEEALRDNHPVLGEFALPSALATHFQPSKWYGQVLDRYRFERLLCRTSQVRCTFFLGAWGA